MHALIRRDGRPRRRWWPPLASPSSPWFLVDLATDYFLLRVVPGWLIVLAFIAAIVGAGLLFDRACG